MFVMPEAIVNSLSEEQYENTFCIFLTLDGIDNFSSAVRFLNVSYPRSPRPLIPGSIIKLTSEVQPLKALILFVTLDGIVMCVSDVQSLKAPSPMCKRLDGSTMSVRDLQPEKALIYIVFTPG